MRPFKLNRVAKYLYTGVPCVLRSISHGEE